MSTIAKHEEMVPLAKMVIRSFTRDRVEFEDSDGHFTTTFLQEFNDKTEVVKTQEKRSTKLNAQKKITKDLYLTADNIKMPLKLASNSFRRADLDGTLFVKAQKSLRTRNIEGAIDHLEAIGQLVNANGTTLAAKGLKPNFIDVLNATIAALYDLSGQQTTLMQMGEDVTDVNVALYADLYKNYIAEVCKTGRIIYADDHKIKEYTISNLLKKLHSAPQGADDSAPTA